MEVVLVVLLLSVVGDSWEILDLTSGTLVSQYEAVAVAGHNSELVAGSQCWEHQILPYHTGPCPVTVAPCCAWCTVV